MPEIKTAQPLEMKVNPRKWTTKVNVAVVIAVVVVFLLGASYAIYASLHPGDVQEDLHEDVSPSAPQR
jgi:hypothetical protein